MTLIFVAILALVAVGGRDAAPYSELPSQLDATAAQVVRVPRRAPRLEDKALAQLSQLAQDHEPLKRSERSGEEEHHHEYVDYGAHTGHKGSFGWYADFPVIQHH